jgi:DNA-binding HxlR family transcriptional regulator
VDYRCRERPLVCTRYQQAAELVGRRWSAAVIRCALDGPVRFTEIRAAVPGLSARLLAERLRELEGAGILERLALNAPSVTAYQLTPKGRGLTRVVRELQAWADEWGD